MQLYLFRVYCATPALLTLARDRQELLAPVLLFVHDPDQSESREAELEPSIMTTGNNQEPASNYTFAFHY